LPGPADRGGWSLDQSPPEVRVAPPSQGRLPHSTLHPPSAEEPQEPRGLDRGGWPLAARQARSASRLSGREGCLLVATCARSRGAGTGTFDACGAARGSRRWDPRGHVLPSLTGPSPAPNEPDYWGTVVPLTCFAPVARRRLSPARPSWGDVVFASPLSINHCLTPLGFSGLTALSRGNWRAAHRQLEITVQQVEGSQPAIGG
jgi:hypothetical protein